MTLSLQTVEHIARLARLALTDEEKARYAAQLSSILDYAARLQTVDVTGIPPTFSVLPEAGELRADAPQPGLDSDTLLDNAPQTQAGQFRVPPVFS
jgi:aspartyl-tRNA(Asn)/glutamyl-tRNA(Gln) amidotransferase subunit C